MLQAQYQCWRIRALLELLTEVLLANAGANTDWVTETLDELQSGTRERDLHVFLGLAPRKLGKSDLRVSSEQALAIEARYPGWRLDRWSVDGAARVVGLASFNCNRPFAELFKDLRRTADAAELIALYRGLPFYPDPDTLDFEIGEALRSNLRPVFESVAQNNPFPRDHFDEHRWNHMILKSLFVDSKLAPIMGLGDRANAELVRMLLDYAEERLAAGRIVSSELWLAVSPFQDDAEFKDRLAAAKLAARENEREHV